MPARIVAIKVTAGVMVFVGILPSIGFCDEEKANLQFYEGCIVQEIIRCRAKASLLNSRSRNLREYARIKVQKATFLADQKESLIQELFEKQITLRDHRIQVYLNRQFYDEID